MPVTAETRYGKTSARVLGEMNIYAAAELKARFATLLGEPGELELNLAEVSECDSAGVQLVLWLLREAARRNRRARVTDASPAVSELVKLYHLESEFGSGAGIRV